MRKVFYLLLIALSLSISIHALVYIVPDGTTQITTLTLPNAGDSALIEEGGTISVTNANGVEMNALNQVVCNQGKIFISGVNTRGIFFSSGNALIINNGQISVSGSGTRGIEQSGIVGSNVVITNTGSILAIGELAAGISSFITGNNSVITNSGSIVVSGDSAFGIANNATGSNIVVVNSGLVSVSGENSSGIISNSDDVHVINSGTVISAQDFAIFLSGADPTLSLLRGSNIQGPVFPSSSPLNLNVETGLNLVLTLDTGGTFGALGIEAPFALVGNDLIAVIDPTGLAMQADVVADLSDTILDAIYPHRTGFPCCIPCGCGIWVQGIGSSRKRSRDKDFVGYDNWQGGFLVGGNVPLWGGNGSLFGGVSFGEAEVDQQTQKADTTSYVGGVTYEWLCRCTFLGAALAVGYVDWDNERFVMNNLAEGGVQKARSNTGGGFITADLTATRHFNSLCCTTMSFS
ncbi:MAG: autotransporter domain-containing protein, partial [Chlamydiales bacterium]